MCKHNVLDESHPCRRCQQVARNPEQAVDDLRAAEEKVRIWWDVMDFYNSTGILREIDLEDDAKEIGMQQVTE